MAYQRITLAELRSRLAERLGGQNNFWSVAEQEMGLNEALAAWQLLTGDFLKSRLVVYAGDGERLLDQGDTGSPMIGTLRAKCIPFSINVTIGLEPGYGESDCDMPTSNQLIETNYTITDAVLPIVSYEWRNYGGSLNTSDPYTILSTEGVEPVSLTLPGPIGLETVPSTVRLFVEDSDGNYGISNALSFCVQIGI